MRDSRWAGRGGDASEPVLNKHRQRRRRQNKRRRPSERPPRPQHVYTLLHVRPGGDLMLAPGAFARAPLHSTPVDVVSSTRCVQCGSRWADDRTAVAALIVPITVRMAVFAVRQRCAAYRALDASLRGIENRRARVADITFEGMTTTGNGIRPHLPHVPAESSALCGARRTVRGAARKGSPACVHPRRPRITRYRLLARGATDV